MPFAKGQSGNIGGRPPGYRRVAREILRETANGVELVEMLLEIARDEKGEIKWRMVAMQMLLDRGFGKAVQTIEMVGDQPSIAPTLNIAALTNEQRWQLREILLRMKGDPRAAETTALPMIDVPDTTDEEEE